MEHHRVKSSIPSSAVTDKILDALVFMRGSGSGLYVPAQGQSNQTVRPALYRVRHCQPANLISCNASVQLAAGISEQKEQIHSLVTSECFLDIYKSLAYSISVFPHVAYQKRRHRTIAS